MRQSTLMWDGRCYPSIVRHRIDVSESMVTVTAVDRFQRHDLLIAAVASVITGAVCSSFMLVSHVFLLIVPAVFVAMLLVRRLTDFHRTRNPKKILFQLDRKRGAIYEFRNSECVVENGEDPGAQASRPPSDELQGTGAGGAPAHERVLGRGTPWVDASRCSLELNYDYSPGTLSGMDSEISDAYFELNVLVEGEVPPRRIPVLGYHCSFEAALPIAKELSQATGIGLTITSLGRQVPAW